MENKAEQILRQKLLAYSTPGLFEQTIEAMEEYANEKLKEALPIILQHAAENVKWKRKYEEGSDSFWFETDKESITSLASDKELLTKIGINE